MKYYLLITLLITFGVENIKASIDDSEECDNTNFESIKPTYAETEEERVMRLNKELIAALNQFDRCIEDVNNSVLNNSSSDASSNTPTNSFASNSAAGNEIVNKKNEPLEIKSNKIVKNDTLPIEDFSEDNGSTPKDIPDIASDDNTARQLRAVAEAEKDPELKAQYWDAYREYKGISTKN